MSTVHEQWWERLGRMIGGWALALIVIWKYPVPPNGIEFMEAAVRWGFLAALITLGVGMAHSTVFGIVLGTMGRWYSFLRWKGKGGPDRRDAEASGGTQLIPSRRKQDEK